MQFVLDVKPLQVSTIAKQKAVVGLKAGGEMLFVFCL